MAKPTIEEFARKHKKEITAWEKWFREQDGKTIAEIDFASEPQLIEREEEKNETKL